MFKYVSIHTKADLIYSFIFSISISKFDNKISKQKVIKLLIFYKINIYIQSF
jgi:hypothetical protein